jgi:alpha-beta hydrolase superfamily lysophospholipase
VHFRAEDGVELNGWFFPAETNSPRSSLVVLLCHGNAGNIGHRLEMAEALLTTGVNLFLFDYRGYGRSQDAPVKKELIGTRKRLTNGLSARDSPGRTS